MLVFFECLIQNARRLDDIAGAHPYELRQAVVRLGEAWLQSDAFAQGPLRLVESLQSDEAARMRVVQRRRRSKCGPASDARRARLPPADWPHSTQPPGYGLRWGCPERVRRDDDSSPPLRFRDPEPRMPPRAAPTTHRRACRYCTRASQPRAPLPAGPRPGSGEPIAVRPAGSEGSLGLHAATRVRPRRCDPR